MKFDAIVGALEAFMITDDFASTQAAFCRAECAIFEDTDENKLEYTPIFERYTDALETAIEAHLASAVPGFDMLEFAEMLEARRETEALDGDAFELLATLSDFDAFKELLHAHKAEREALDARDAAGLDSAGVLSVGSVGGGGDGGDGGDGSASNRHRRGGLLELGVGRRLRRLGGGGGGAGGGDGRADGRGGAAGPGRRAHRDPRGRGGEVRRRRPGFSLGREDEDARDGGRRGGGGTRPKRGKSQRLERRDLWAAQHHARIMSDRKKPFFYPVAPSSRPSSSVSAASSRRAAPWRVRRSLLPPPASRARASVRPLAMSSLAASPAGALVARARARWLLRRPVPPPPRLLVSPRAPGLARRASRPGGARLAPCSPGEPPRRRLPRS